MAKLLIKNGMVVNRGVAKYQDILIINDRIAKIDGTISEHAGKVIDASGKWVMPGIIDDQVHFREPGLTHKADIASESAAAVIGGVTSFMEMPNTIPQSISRDLLEEKYAIAARTSAANYSFYMGATNANLDEVLRTDPRRVCGIKAFMGSSTGNMLVDDPQVLEALFSRAHMLVATHCEDEKTIRENKEIFKTSFYQLSPSHHPEIRSREACLRSSTLAVELARKYDTRLHVLHISTLNELALFDAGPIESKRITAEACVHHLYYNDEDYQRLGAKIVCNPAIKTETDRQAIMDAVLRDIIDVIATDHAPHTIEEKNVAYPDCPSGLPLIQYSLLMMLAHYHRDIISIEKIVEKMCHAPALLFHVVDRGYLDEGKKADVIIVDPNFINPIDNADVAYKCGWTPLDGTTLKGKVETTIVNGVIKYHQNVITSDAIGERLSFDR